MRWEIKLLKGRLRFPPQNKGMGLWERPMEAQNAPGVADSWSGRSGMRESLGCVLAENDESRRAKHQDPGI